MLRVLATLLLAVFFAACTEIPITEADAFQNKRTITPETFDVPGFTLTQHSIPLADVAIPDSLDADSLALDAWFMQHTGFNGEPARGTVLYFGGQGFLMVTFADFIEAMAQHRVNLFMVDYRGYGMSDGEPSVAGLKADGLAVYDYVQALDGVDPDRLVLHGHSMGTFMATYVAQEAALAPRGLLLESPVTTVEELTSALVPALLKPLVSFDIDDALQREDNPERVAGLTMPTLVIVGGEDNITPPKLAEDVHEASVGQPKRLVEVESGGHNGLEAYDAFHSALAEFYDTALGS
ncbi:MAG: alpha/beta fold hydrolase [Bacteroidota bacterium]